MYLSNVSKQKLLFSDIKILDWLYIIFIDKTWLEINIQTHIEISIRNYIILTVDTIFFLENFIVIYRIIKIKLYFAYLFFNKN